MFKKASRLKLRFPTTRGALTVEDLWYLPLTSVSGPSLDNVAIAANKEVKASGEESFVEQKSSTSTVAVLKLDLVKEIIKVRLAEAKEYANAAAVRAKKEQILTTIARKDDEALEGKSREDLLKMVEDL